MITRGSKQVCRIMQAWMQFGRWRCKRLHRHFNLNYKDLEYVVRLVLVPVCYRKDEVSFPGSLDLWILVRSVV